MAMNISNADLAAFHSTERFNQEHPVLCIGFPAVLCSPMLDDAGRILKWCGVVTDVEDFRRAEETLRRGELDLQLIVDSIPVPVAVTMPSGGGRGPQSGHAQLFWQDPGDAETRLRRADDVYRWFNVLAMPLRDVDGHILRWFELLIDIDDRKRAEAALQAANDRLARASQIASLVELSASIYSRGLSARPA